MSKITVDVFRTDVDYWRSVLDREGLGMNRGTTSLDDDAVIESEPIKRKRGRPRKTGPKHQHINFTRQEAQASTRPTYTSSETNGVFQVGGFRHYGSSTAYGAGRNRSGQKGDRRDFLTYVGNDSDLAKLEERISLQEAGRVSPTGHGVDK